ncbi:hypothetical protein AB0942_08025 [Streptomyces nodosus]|uniref:hypothetical protein n=1 Tax=Streptomyces nodosus TaxID=40318 RepID=UPI003455D74D
MITTSEPSPATAPPSVSATRPASPRQSAPDPGAKPAPGCTDHVELTAADSGRTLCLAVGRQVRITLDGAKDRPWTPVKSTGTGLRAANAGIGMPPGDGVAAFDAVMPGTARLASSRLLCAAHPGRVACHAIREWTVIVRVTPS